MWQVLLAVLVVSDRSFSWPPDSDCLTADGTVGVCTAPSECFLPHGAGKPVMCRYSVGYTIRICCPHSSVQSQDFTFPSGNDRDDFYSNDQPIVFPSEPAYNGYQPHNLHTTSSHQNPLLFGASHFRPQTPPHDRPIVSQPKPGYQERPSSYHGYQNPATFNGFEKPSFSSSNGYERPASSSSNSFKRPSSSSSNGYERPSSSSSNSFQKPSSSSSKGSQRPSSSSSNGSQRPSSSSSNGFERPSSSSSNSFQRPSSSNGFQKPSTSSQERPNRYIPKPAWGTDSSEGENIEGGWPNQPNRKTTPRPTWSVENGGQESSSGSKKRISELKCEEYSRPVSQTIDVLPLSIDAEAVPLRVQKCDYSAVKLIVGGEASELGEFPHMAAVGFRTTGSRNIVWNCGGTLVSDRYVLTAGHCINTTFGNPVIVRLGEYNLAQDNDGADPVDYRVEKIIVHPNYFKSLKYNDIALIRLTRSVKFNKNVRPACLPQENSIQGKPMATGWGRTDYVGKQSDILMKVSLNVVENRLCNQFYSTNNPGSSSFASGIVDTMLCAGVLQGGRDTCLGDSGGPLTITKKDNPCIYYVIGITSFGKICAAPNAPGVYTRVAKYLPWIERTIWPNYT